MNRLRIRLTVAIILACFSSASCTHSSTIAPVSGTVTFDGQPLPSGNIVFEPTDDKTQMRQATITDGKFSLGKREGLIVGGIYKVVIKGFRKTGRKYENVKMAASADEVEQFLPEEYNTSTTLQVTISAHEAENHLTYDLKSNPEN